MPSIQCYAVSNLTMDLSTVLHYIPQQYVETMAVHLDASPLIFDSLIY